MTEVLRPLGMKNSTFAPPKKQCVPTELTATRGLIQGEVHDPKAFISVLDVTEAMGEGFTYNRPKKKLL